MQQLRLNIPDVDERGVSPVIGVVLMVAITVILGAIIATFTFGFPAQVHDTARAGADVSVDENTAQVTWLSEGNADKLRVEVTNGSGGSETTDLETTGEFVTVENLGKSGGLCSPYSGTITANSSEVTIVVTAVNENSQTVIRTETVNLEP